MKKRKQVTLTIYARMWTTLASRLQFSDVDNDKLDTELRKNMIDYLLGDDCEK